MTIKKKKASGGGSLPEKWKMKVFTDNSSGTLRLSAQLRQWLESHEHFHGNREILAVISGRALLCLAGRCGSPAGIFW